MSFPRGLAESLMRQAIDLARRGQGRVEPNPMVGAVIVNDSGTVISEGWHRYFGGPHAEVDALAAAGPSARGSTLFVTLEPCCHFGKTPPCTRALISAGIRRVFVAMRDPAPHVDGGGIKELREAGIEVEVGLLEQEASRVVAPFVRLVTEGRPWFHAKWAMTLDGKIASRTGNSQWISNESSRAKVHALRGRMDALLVGIGTVLSDDPLLTARPAGSRIAARVILDSHARLLLSSQLVQTASQAPIILFATSQAPKQQCNELRSAGVDVVAVRTDSSGHTDLSCVAQELGNRKMTNVLIEGGSEVFGAFFDARLIDEAHVFIAPKLVGGKAAAAAFGGHGLDSIPASSSLESPVVESLDGDIYINGRLLNHGT